MKRFGIVLLVLAFFMLAIACSGKPAKAPDPFEGKSLETLLDEIHAGADVEIPLMTTEITADNEQYHLGTTGLKFSEAFATGPGISAIAYSVCLVRLHEGEDVEAAKKAIKENVDPEKWICVRVDEKNVIVDSAGNVIILIMTDKYATGIHNSFKALAGI